MFNKIKSFQLKGKKKSVEIIKQELRFDSSSKVVGIMCATFGTQTVKNVLDFSSVTQQNIDFFSQFSCHYQVLDFYSQWQQMPNVEERFTLVIEYFEKKLSNNIIKKYDAIFLWDILNYIDIDQSKQIFQLIEEFCHWKTHIYCLLHTRDIIPVKPVICYAVDHNTIGYNQSIETQSGVNNPHHDRFGARQLAPGFSLQYSSLLKNGMKELLFSLDRKS